MFSKPLRRLLLLVSLALATNCDDGTTPPADDAPPPADKEAPGELVSDPDSAGRGSCAFTTIASLLDQIHAAHPDLADIRMIYRGGLIGDGSFVYPYLRDDGGFAFVLKRGGGDCPAGCTENEYWYFATDRHCKPQQVGHYQPRFSSGDEPCIEQDGKPMFGRPPTPDPAFVCGADNSAEDLAGDYAFNATGQRILCATSSQEPDRAMLDIEVSIALVQDQDDPSRGTATVSDTGYPLLDGRPLPATFIRQRVDADETFSNLPAACAASHTIHVSYDFEGFGERVVHLEEVATPDCKAAPDDYCKGGLNLNLELIE